MATISISLTKLGDAAASEAMANITLELFKAYRNVIKLMINEQRRLCELSKRMAAEQEKKVANQRELDGSPPSLALAATVSHQEKNVANQRKLNASPPSRASASSVSCQERNGAIRRELNASPPSWASASSVSCVERNDAIQRKLASSSTSRPPKFRKISDLSTPALQTLTRTEDVNLQDSSDNKRRTKITPSSNTNRVIPAYRRQKVEGVLLLDEED